MAFAFVPAGADTEDAKGALWFASRVCWLSRIRLLPAAANGAAGSKGVGEAAAPGTPSWAPGVARSGACGAPRERECAVAPGNAPQFGEIVRCPHLIEQCAGDLIVRRS